ncbi:MAG: hypothetical protein ACI9W5_000362, partial [Ulvibacter sp.]
SLGNLSAKMIANWFNACFQLWIGIVHFFSIFLKAKYKSLEIAMSFFNIDLFYRF